MNKKQLTVIWFAIFSCLNATQAMASPELNEANAEFTYQGKPIHPGLIQQFMPSIADPGEPTTISVDVSAEHPNNYFDGDVEIKNKNVCLKTKEDGSFFCYQWLGKMANGLHVLDTSDSGGGSGIFGTLIFVRFDRGEGIDFTGNKYKRLLLSVVREYPLGDRDDRTIKVQHDKVIIGSGSQQVILY